MQFASPYVELCRCRKHPKNIQSTCLDLFKHVSQIRFDGYKTVS